MRRFWPMLTLMMALIIGVSYLTSTLIVPFEYQLTDPFVQVPLLFVAIPHILYCFVLNRVFST